MIIDCHTHINNYRQEPGGAAEQIRRLRAEVERNRLDHCFVLSSYRVNDDRPSTEEVLRLVDKDPRLHVVEGVGVTNDTDWAAIEQRLRTKETIGLKFYPGYEHFYPTDKVFQPGVQLAGKYRVPIMIHSGDTFNPKAKLKFAHPLHVDELAVDNPDVNFIICHLGNPWFMDTAEIIYKNDNVHADISGLVLTEFTAPLESYMLNGLKELLLFSGEHDSLLYGTDWPLVNMPTYLKFVHQLGLEPEVFDMLMGGNAARLFKFPHDAKRPVVANRRPSQGPEE